MKWEYKTVEFESRKFFSSKAGINSLQDELNCLGNNDWELVRLELNLGSLAIDIGAIAILKRPK